MLLDTIDSLFGTVYNIGYLNKILQFNDDPN